MAGDLLEMSRPTPSTNHTYLTSITQKGLDFLHEHRIIHGDILTQNTGVNAWFQNICPLDPLPPGIRNPSVAQYVYYDFGTSWIYARNVALDQVQKTKHVGLELRRLTRPSGPYNPFQFDVTCLGFTFCELQVSSTYQIDSLGFYNIVGVGQSIPTFVLGFEQLLDRMASQDEKEHITAREALQEFWHVTGRLATSQLTENVQESL